MGGRESENHESVHCEIPYIPRQIQMIWEKEKGGTCGTHGEKRYAYRILVRRSEAMRLHSRSRRRWEGNG